jgi:fructose-1,6-bisphosphatase/inositol monophosphatase family enzyme
MISWDLDKIIRSLVHCSSIAREAKEHLKIQVKTDRTPVTEADQKIEAYLTAVFGQGNVLGEETFEEAPSHEKLLSDLYNSDMVIVDPIDGTANFINNRPYWAISIGLSRKGLLSEGAIFMPEEGVFLCSDRGKTFLALTGTYPDAAEISRALKEFQGPLRKFDCISMVNLSQIITKSGGYHGVNPVFTGGSCVSSGVDLIRGRDCVYITGAKLWDLAGIVPCLRNAGFACTSPSGLDLLSGKITEELFQLKKDSPVPFALHEMNLIGVSAEAVRTVLADCDH